MNPKMNMMVNTCPFLLPVDKELSAYQGYIIIQGKEYKMRICGCKPGCLKDVYIETDWELAHLLKGCESIIQQRASTATDLGNLMLEVKTIIEKRLNQEHSVPQVSSSVACKHLINQIEKVGWDNLISVDKDFKDIKLKYRDIKNRQHIIQLSWTTQNSQERPNVIVDIPGRVEFVWNSQSTLDDIYRQFTYMVDQYQDFWDVMEQLDKNTWILEPEKPTFAAAYRRIVIGSNASLQFTVNPDSPRMLPECRFLGADNVVSPLCHSMNENLHLWNSEKPLLENLQKLLGIEFPSPQTSKKEDFSVACGICYAYRLDTEIPEKACDDSRCAQPFHQTCLYEWLRGLQSSRQSFNTIFGECPYCEKPITVKMPAR